MKPIIACKVLFDIIINSMSFSHEIKVIQLLGIYTITSLQNY